MNADLLMGEREKAAQTGDLMLRFFREQPDLNIGIYNYYHPDLGYLTDIDHENSFERIFARVGWKQPFANLGFLLIGLARLYEATGKKESLDGCLEIMDFLIENHREDLIAHAQNHKIGYAAAILYRITENAEYIHIASEIAGRLSGNIGKYGRAWADVVSPDLDSQPYYTSVRMTADAVLWLRQIFDLCESLSLSGDQSKK